MSLVQRIRNLCHSKSMTFAELERVLGFSNGQIRRWEKTKPGIDKIQKVADYFDVSVDYLLGREKETYSGEQPQTIAAHLNGELHNEEDVQYILSLIERLKRENKGD